VYLRLPCNLGPSASALWCRPCITNTSVKTYEIDKIGYLRKENHAAGGHMGTDSFPFEVTEFIML
jgi:hypothetical protein